MIISSGKIVNSPVLTVDLYLSRTEPSMNYGSFFPQFVNAKSGAEDVKPLLFDVNKTVSQYRETAECITNMARHLNAERVMCLNPAFTIAGDIFNLKSQKDIFIHILKTLNPDHDLSEIIPFIPDEVNAELNKRNSESLTEFCVILLNQPYEILDIEHMKRLANRVSYDDYFDPCSKALVTDTPRNFLLFKDHLDDFLVNVYTIKDASWVKPKEFVNACISDDADDIANWVKNNYGFIRKVLMTYFDPGNYKSYSKNKGFIFTPFISFLYSIQTKIDLTYWDFSRDLWINLNLIGYNPNKDLNQLVKHYNSPAAKLMMTKLSSSDIMELFINSVNSSVKRFGGKIGSLQMQEDKLILDYVDPMCAVHTLRGNGKLNPTELDKLVKKFIRLKRDDDTINAFVAAIDVLDASNKRKPAVWVDYKIDVRKYSVATRIVHFVYGMLPAFTSSGTLHFSELVTLEDASFTDPNFIDMLYYLYNHRGWLSKEHPVGIGRGRTATIHAHTAVFTHLKAWKENGPLFDPSKPPHLLFEDGFKQAAKNQNSDIDGPDFQHLSDHLAKELDDRFFYISTPYDLVNEGKLMNHCCGGSHYISECHSEERMFFHFQPADTEHYTEGVTFDLDISIYDSNPITLSSMQLYRNHSVPKAWGHEINDFVSRLNKAEIKYRKTLESDQLAKAC